MRYVRSNVSQLKPSSHFYQQTQPANCFINSNLHRMRYVRLNVRQLKPSLHFYQQTQPANCFIKTFASSCFHRLQQQSFNLELPRHQYLHLQPGFHTAIYSLMFFRVFPCLQVFSVKSTRDGECVENVAIVPVLCDIVVDVADVVK